jgi:hypothetical protein
MDVLYLEKNVSRALVDALAVMIMEQPDDCVEFLGNHLLEYVARREADEKVIFSLVCLGLQSVAFDSAT